MEIILSIFFPPRQHHFCHPLSVFYAVITLTVASLCFSTSGCKPLFYCFCFFFVCVSLLDVCVYIPSNPIGACMQVRPSCYASFVPLSRCKCVFIPMNVRMCIILYILVCVPYRNLHTICVFMFIVCVGASASHFCQDPAPPCPSIVSSGSRNLAATEDNAKQTIVEQYMWYSAAHWDEALSMYLQQE